MSEPVLGVQALQRRIASREKSYARLCSSNSCQCGPQSTHSRHSSLSALPNLFFVQGSSLLGIQATYLDLLDDEVQGRPCRSAPRITDLDAQAEGEAEGRQRGAHVVEMSSGSQ